MKFLAVLCTFLAIYFTSIKNVGHSSFGSHISETSSRFIKWKIGLLESVTFQLLLRMLSSFSTVNKKFRHLHFSDLVVEIGHRHVENVIFLGKTNTAIHGPHINGVGSSMAIIILTIWKKLHSLSEFKRHI